MRPWEARTGETRPRLGSQGGAVPGLGWEHAAEKTPQPGLSHAESLDAGR